MITGVVCILLAEAAMHRVFASLLLWAVAFFAVLAVVIRGWEEPHLHKALRRRIRGVPAQRPAWLPTIVGLESNSVAAKT